MLRKRRLRGAHGRRSTTFPESRGDTAGAGGPLLRARLAADPQSAWREGAHPQGPGEYFNGQPQNIGVLLGEPSRGLVDVAPPIETEPFKDVNGNMRVEVRSTGVQTIFPRTICVEDAIAATVVR